MRTETDESIQEFLDDPLIIARPVWCKHLSKHIAFAVRLEAEISHKAVDILLWSAVGGVKSWGILTARKSYTA